jgi:hypothetical protein
MHLLATARGWTENQAASLGRLSKIISRHQRHGTNTTVGRIAVGLTTRNERDSRENPNTAHFSHLQEAVSISHPTSSSGVYLTFGNSEIQFQFSLARPLSIFARISRICRICWAPHCRTAGPRKASCKKAARLRALPDCQALYEYLHY